MNFEEERANWLVDSYCWLNRSLSKKKNDQAGWIVLPTYEFFPVKHTKDHNYASQVFEIIQSIMEVSDWDCELQCAHDIEKEFQRKSKESGILGPTSSSSPAGMFEAKEGKVLISYSSEKLTHPVSLIATLAHELSHYLLGVIEEDPPGGWEDLEFLTDLTAVKEGFGIFLCESAFQFNTFSDAFSEGWSIQTQGYLSESELAFSLALYSVLNEVEPETVGTHLGQNALEIYYLALDDIEEQEDWISKLKESNLSNDNTDKS